MIQRLEAVGEFKFHNWVVQMYGSLEEPLFRAVDIAKVIDYSFGNAYQMVAGLQEGVDKILVHKTFMDQRYSDVISNGLVTTKCSHQRGGNRKPEWYLTEFGLYEVLFRSTKPIAKEFKLVVKQILRDIRRTGKFEAPEDTPKFSFEYLDKIGLGSFYGYDEEIQERIEWLEENQPGYYLEDVGDPYTFDWSNPPGGVKD